MYDAIVLAGGRGSRLGGVDKGAVDIGGVTLLQRVLTATARQHLVGHDDQSVTSQQGQWFAELFVNSDLAATHIGIVKARHIVMYQRSTVQQFDSRSSCIA